MGVEYRHFLVVGDPGWLPKADTASRVDDVLRKWSLVTKEPDIYDLAGGGKQRLNQPISILIPGPGYALTYPMVKGRKVSAVVGPCFYPEIGEEERYIQGIALVVGNDFRIHWSWEGTCFTVLQPPTNSGVPVDPYSGEQHLYLYAEAYPTGPQTTPPKVEVDVYNKDRHHIGWDHYNGFWRSALVLDCGKDLPSFIEGKFFLLCKEFVQAVSDAFRSPVLEVGEIY
jgi:hypothetical protein